MNVQTWWDDTRVAIAIQTLKTYPKFCNNALCEISDRLGRTVSYDMLRNGLRRAGKGSPGSYCSELLASPVEEYEPHTDPMGALVDGYFVYPNPDAKQRHASPLQAVAPSVERVVLLPDSHHKYRDPIAYPLALRAIEAFKPDTLVVLGDFADLDSCSSHSKEPSRRYNLADELKEANLELDKLDAIGASRKVFCEGNHEYRLRRYIADKAPELDGIVSIEEALGLERRKWEFVPYRSFATVGKLHVTHDCGYSGMTAAARSREAFNANVAIGHCHNATITYRGDARGNSKVGFSVGWLGDPKQISYMHKIDTTRNWQHGFGIAYIERDTGNCHVHFIPIVEGRCVVEGKIIS